MSVIANIRIHQDGWDVGNYRFKRIRDGKKGNITYYRASASLRRRVPVRRSVLYEGGTELDDILILHNLFMRGNACLEDKFDLYLRKVNPGPDISGQGFNECMNTALTTIRRRGWKSTNRDKILAFNWMLRARVKDELQIAFFNNWVVFELLVKHNNDIDAFLQTFGIRNFILFRRFWREIRNGTVHSGLCEYSYFRAKGLLGIYSSGVRRYSEGERRYFRRNIKKRNFLQFQADSEAIMDIVSTFYFASLLGITNLRRWYHNCYFQRLQYYDSNLKFPPPEDIHVIYRR